MQFWDTHAHLCSEPFASDRDAVLKRAQQAGVQHVVEIADDPSEWAQAIALSRARPGQVRCSLGLHPYYADKFSGQLLEDLKLKTALPEVVAIGEIGLDYVKTDIPRPVQINALENLLAACSNLDKPAVIHCRGAYEDLRAIFKNFYSGPPQKNRFHGVVHCFSGNTDDALFCSGLGFALGVDGPITYPKNDELRRAFKEVGAACLVLETDSPYLPPQSSRGKRNEPRAIPEIGGKLAETLGMPLPELARTTSENARALFRL